MQPATRDRLLALNRKFYADVSEPFHNTRRSWPQGNVRLLDFVPATDAHRPLRILDAGCGNGRFAAVLNSLDRPVRYTGVDGNLRLLERADELAAGLAHVDADFVHGDLAGTEWVLHLDPASAVYDVVVCLSTLQHMPGRELRTQVVCTLAERMAPHGRLAVSAWQFLTSPRLAARQIAWETAGIDETDVDPGDALLPWKQDVYAVRYVHQIDRAEMEALASDAGLRICNAFFADGRTGDLNLYAVLEAPAGVGPNP